MTMHLEKAYLTTTRYNSKTKKTKSKRLAQAHTEHDAWLKSMGVGKTKLPTNARGERVGIYDIPDYKEHQATATLSNRVAANGTARDSNKYTGDYIIGIATTHKSNLVPITSKKQAVEASQMRRN